MKGQTVGSVYRYHTYVSRFKMYAEVVSKRLKRQVEDKGCIPYNQTGLRKGMATTYNIVHAQLSSQ